MTKYCWLLLALLFYMIPVVAQQAFCGTLEFDHVSNRNNAAFQQLSAIRKMKEANFNRRNPVAPLAVPDTIPVVVHVIHTGSAIGSSGNPSDAAINNMIAILNQACSATYPGYPTVASGGVNLGLYFKLAQKAPGCTATNGIVRVNAAADQQYISQGVSFDDAPTGISHAQLAAKSYWDNTAYYNIWLVNKFDPSWLGGYAYYPTGTKTIYDGLVMLATGISSPYVITHEIGHSFNLAHTFYGADGSECAVNNNCSAEGDWVCDTDPHLQDIGCNPNAINSCTGNPFGNLVFNFMNYNCHNQFTQGQYQRVRYAVDNYRRSLIMSDAKWPPLPAPAPQVAAAGSVNFCDGDSVELFCTNVEFVQWQLNGQDISTPSAMLFAKESGSYKAISINEQGCRSVPSDNIVVTRIQLPAASLISVLGSPDICAGQPAKLVCDDTLHNQWYKDDVLIIGASSYKYSATVGGLYSHRKVNDEGCVSALSNILSINIYQPEFLGVDTVIFLTCYRDSIDLPALFTTTSGSFHWNIVQPERAPIGEYELQATNNAGCTDTVHIAVKFEIAKWLGLVDNDFFNAENWSTKAIPDEKTAVLILADTPNTCILDRGTAKVASVQLQPGAKFSVVPPAQLFLSGSCPEPLP